MTTCLGKSYSFGLPRVPFVNYYERDFMTSLSDVKQAEIIETFKSTSSYLDDLLNIDNPYLKAWSIVFIHLNCS